MRPQPAQAPSTLSLHSYDDDMNADTQGSSWLQAWARRGPSTFLANPTHAPALLPRSRQHRHTHTLSLSTLRQAVPHAPACSISAHTSAWPLHLFKAAWNSPPWHHCAAASQSHTVGAERPAVNIARRTPASGHADVDPSASCPASTTSCDDVFSWTQAPLTCLPAVPPHTRPQSRHHPGPAPWPSCTAHWQQPQQAAAGRGRRCTGRPQHEAPAEQQSRSAAGGTRNLASE